MRIFLLSLLFFCTTLGLQAQDIDFGIKVGANFSAFSDAADFDNKTGFVGGAFLDVKVNDNYNLQIELLYSQQGTKFNLGKIKLDYVLVPVVLKIYLIKRLNIQVGPQFGFVVDDNVDKVLRSIDEAQSFDFTGIVGVGLDLPLGVRVDARYNFGINSALKEGRDGRNVLVSLALGFSLF